MGTEKVICDSDVLIDYFNQRNSRHLSTMNMIDNIIGLENINISVITQMELFSNVRDKQQLKSVEARIKGFNVLKINPNISDLAVKLIHSYNLSHKLAIPDALIAATAIYVDIPLFTYNLKDFRFIDSINLYSQNPSL